MTRNQGFVLTKLLPFILLLGAIVLTALLLGQRTGWFNRAAPLTSPNPSSWGDAIVLDGRSYATAGQTGHPQRGYTVEAWIKPYQKIFNSYILAKFSPNRNSMDLQVKAEPDPQGSGKYLVSYYFNVADTSQYCNQATITKQRLVTPEELTSWQHIAGVIQDDRKLDIFVNGERSTTNFNSISDVCLIDDPLTIGARKVSSSTIEGFFNGQIDEIRVSTIPRYQNNFTPPTNPFTSDAYTRLLYHLNGNLLDSSGNNFNGTGTGTMLYTPSTIGLPTPVILKNLLLNPSFEIGLESSGGAWLKKNLETNDRRQQSFPTNGFYTFRFAPDSSSQQESLYQTINYPGKANDSLNFTVDSYVPSPYITGQVGAVIVVKYTDTTIGRNSVTFKIPSPTTQNKISICATKPYNQVKVVLFNQAQNQPNTTPYYFVDNTKLTIQPNVANCVQTPSALTPQQLSEFN